MSYPTTDESMKKPDVNHAAEVESLAARPAELPAGQAVADARIKALPHGSKEEVSKEDPLTIAKRRLALGEITPAEFKKIKDLLRQ